MSAAKATETRQPAISTIAGQRYSGLARWLALSVTRIELMVSSMFALLSAIMLSCTW